MERFDGASKHATLREWIRMRIESGEFSGGERLPSENELSEQFGVSRQTVRQAIGALESEGLLKRRRGSGTYVETGVLAREKTMTIGVVADSLDDFIFPAIIRGIDKVLCSTGYTMDLAITRNSVKRERDMLSALLERRVDGMIIEPTKSAFTNANLPLYKRLEQNKVPCLFINGYYPDVNIGYVALDDFAAGKMATEYLIQHGHVEIGGIFRLDDVRGHLRCGGCRQAVTNANIGINVGQSVWLAPENGGLLDDEDNVMRRIDGCTGVVCCDDQIAVKLMKLLKKRGLRVPDDVSLISIGNSGLAEAAGLTTINHPKERLGEETASRLLKLIAQPDLSMSLQIAPDLTERDSVRMV